jgi:hypothetical protein
MQNQPSTRITNWLGGDDIWQNGIDEEFRYECYFGDRAWITRKTRGDQKMLIIAFGEMIIFLGLADLSAPGGSHCCS